MKKIFFLAICLSLGLGVIAAQGSAEAADYVEGELLLTAAPPEEGADRDVYLASIAEAAGASVVKVYSALSLTEDDPILLMIRSDTKSTDAMLEALKDDKRVISASPNWVRSIRKTN